MDVLQKRLKSLAWRAGAMALVVILDGIAKMCTDGTFNVPGPWLVILGLLIGEVTKFINTRLADKR